MRFATLLAASCVALLGPAANAATIVQTDSEAAMQGFLPFDPAQGTLNSVTLDIKVTDKATSNSFFSATASPGIYAVSYVVQGQWIVGSQYTSSPLVVPVSASGATTFNAYAVPNGVVGSLDIDRIGGFNTFSLNPSPFIGKPNQYPPRIVFDGNYRGLYDIADTTFTLPPSFTARRTYGTCGRQGPIGDDFCGSVNYTLTYDFTAFPGVPEPASWALMLLGFGLIGAGLRRRSTKVVYA